MKNDISRQNVLIVRKPIDLFFNTQYRRLRRDHNVSTIDYGNGNDIKPSYDNEVFLDKLAEQIILHRFDYLIIDGELAVDLRLKDSLWDRRTEGTKIPVLLANPISLKELGNQMSSNCLFDFYYSGCDFGALFPLGESNYINILTSGNVDPGIIHNEWSYVIEDGKYVKNHFTRESLLDIICHNSPSQ